MTDSSTVGLLRRPLPPESVGWKVQTNPKPKNGGGHTKGLAVAFIDARTVVARLNTAVPDAWSDVYFAPPVGTGLMCALTVNGITRVDIGFSSATNTDMGVKGLYSDAFKRAAVKFEVGAFLYSLPKQYVDAADLTQRGDKWFMPDRAVAKLRGNYAQWLKAEGVKYFGEALAHGDAPDPQGDVEVPGDRVADETPADGKAAQIVERLANGKPTLLEFARAAIRAKDARRYKDDAEWESLVDGAPSAKEFWDLLKEELVELGADPKQVHDAWKGTQ